MNSIEPLVIQVSPIHDVEGAWLEHQLVQDVHVVDLGGCHNDHARDVPSQVQQGVQLDSTLGSSESRPWEQRKAKVDGCGVQGIRGLNEIDPNTVARIQKLSAFDQDLRKVAKNPPIPGFVGIGERALGYFSTDSGMIQLALHRAQARSDVSQTFSESQLSKHHDHELAIARESSRPPVSTIPLDALVELVSRQEIQQLRKNDSPLVHASTPRPLSGEGKSAERNFPFEIEKSFLPRR